MIIILLVLEEAKHFLHCILQICHNIHALSILAYHSALQFTELSWPLCYSHPTFCQNVTNTEWGLGSMRLDAVRTGWQVNYAQKYSSVKLCFDIRACLSSSHPMEELAVGETVTPIVVFICKKLVCSNPPENVRYVHQAYLLALIRKVANGLYRHC